jgi:protein-arginine kinase
MLEAQAAYAALSLSDLARQAVEEKVQAAQAEIWHRELRELQDAIAEAGGLGLGETKEEIIENLRKIRQEIFEQEYAPLYREQCIHHGS